MIAAAERDRYFLWKEWVLGEERYAGRGARSSPRPNVGYGDPKRGQKPVPQTWWMALEAFLTRRNDKAEPGVRPKPGPKPVPVDVGRLTAHFHIREFACKDGRHVPKIAVPALLLLCKHYLEPMRAEFGPGTVMSGYRPADYNAEIGGASQSQHIYELTPSSVAADLIFARGRAGDWYAKAVALGAGGAGRYSSFVHLDNRPGRARWSG